MTDSAMGERGYEPFFANLRTTSINDREVTMAEKNLRLKSARAGRLLTQLALSEQVGCTERIITLVENGRMEPTLGLALRIAEALGVPMGELFPSLAGLADMRKK